MNYSPRTLTAARLLGRQIRTGRIERRWTARELAQRAAVSTDTLAKVERGDPSVKLGTVFDLAALVGVSLFDESDARVRGQLVQTEDRLSLLPRRIRTLPDDGDDDF